MPNITIIGAGVMGNIFLEALIKGGNAEITITDHSAEKLNLLRAKHANIKISQNNADSVSSANLIIFAVKPQSFLELASEIKGKISDQAVVVSIMAGVRMQKIEEELGVKKIIRAMPNLGARIGKSMTVWIASDAISTSEKKGAKSLFDKIGQDLYVENEELIDKATAVSGSGPGFFFALAEAWLAAVVDLGFSKQDAEKLLFNTIEASVALLRDRVSPAELKQQVASKGGTTEAGLVVLEKVGLEKIWKETLRAAFKRAQELSQ